MLQVYRGIATKNYENSFFREFAKNLSQLFEKYGLDGLLIGNSECNVDNRLQIDALLITKHAVCIIDFKNFGGKIQLPHTSDFLFGRWSSDKGEMVKGGSSINPYCQLKTQRKRFYDVFKSSIEPKLPMSCSFNPGHTVRVVCFQNEIQLLGTVPSEDEVNFKIIHSGNYLERIKDIIDVKDKEVNLQKDAFPIFLEIFEADAFSLTESYGVAFENTNETTNLNFAGLREDQNAALAEFNSFLANENERVFILQGTSNSGKTHLIPFLKELAFESAISQVEILAPSSRIANNLVGKIDDIGSLYSYIYGGNNFSEHEDEAGDVESEQVERNPNSLSIVPLKKSDNDENALFIIDESQLISDSYHQSIDLRFGSGYLLKDFLKFLNFNESKRKVVFIGDCYQISLGNANENALAPIYLSEKYEMQVRAFQLDDNAENNIILKNALTCISGLRQNLFNKLAFDFSKSFYPIDKDQVQSIFKEYLDNSDEFKFLTYTNEEAQKVNLWVKRNILQNGKDLSIGDLLLLNNNISVEELDNPFSKPQKIYNGQFLILQSYGNLFEEKIELKGNKSVELFFREIKVKLLGKEASVKLLVLENFRNSTKGELSEDELIAIKVLLNKEVMISQVNSPFEKSPLYQNFIKSDEYRSMGKEVVELRKLLDAGEKVKTKLETAERQLRVLTNKVKRKYRLELEKELMKDPSSKYFKMRNLALLRYGWAMNVHKAMSYKWDNVLFNADWNGGTANASYFKWLYTGITRAKQKIHLLNFEAISPTSKTDFKDISTDTTPNNQYYAVIDKEKKMSDSDLEILNRLNKRDTKYSILIAELYKIVESKLYGSKLNIKSIQHPDYQQVYTLTDGSNEVKIRFYYDGDLRIKFPSIQNGSNQDLNDLAINLLTKNLTISDFSFIKHGWRREFFEFVNSQLTLNGLYFQSIVQHLYKDIVNVRSNDGAILTLEANYNDDGFYTSILAKHYSEVGLWNLFIQNVKYYI